MSTHQRILFAIVVSLVLLGAAGSARADLNISVAPNPVSIPQGGNATVTITSQILPGFPSNAESIEYTLTSFSAGAAVGVTRTFAPSFGPASMMILINSTTAPGTYTGTIAAVVKDAGGNVVGTKDFPNAVTVNVTAVPCDFEILPEQTRVTVPQGGTAPLRIFASATGGCSGAFTFNATSPAGVTVNSPQTTTFPNTTVTFNFSASATAPAGLFATTVTVQGSGATHTVSIPLEVLAVAQPDFSLSVAPPAGVLVSGQTAVATVTVTPANGFNSPVAIAISAPSNAVTAAPVTMTSPYAPAPVTLQLNGSGSIPVTFTATSGTLQKTTAVTLSVQPAQTSAFDLQVTPTDLAVTAGQSGAVTVRAAGSGGFSGTVNVVSPAVTDPNAGVTFNPSTFTLAANEARTVTVAVSGASRATTVPLALEFRGTSGTLSDAAPLRLTIAAPVTGDGPSIQAITPMAYAPQPAQEFIVLGRNFAPGATVAIQQPERGAIAVTATRYISPAQLGVTISVTADTPAGRGYRVTVTNADGRTTSEQVVLVVAPQGSLGGPAAVTRVAIEYPIRGQVIASGKGSIAAAHLATSGSGTISGRWRLRQSGNTDDPGYVFDQFTATVAGGFLVSTDRPCFDSAGRAKTTAHVCASIPMLHRGTYHLELVVDQPRLVTPASVPVTIQSDSATELTVYRPRENGTIDRHDPEFSWTQLPGVQHYNVEFQRVPAEDAQALPIVIEVPQSTWRPDVRELRARRGLAPGTYRWRVIAVYPGDLRGQATDWLTVTFADLAFTSARHVATVASAEITALDLPQEGDAAADPAATYTIAPNATITGGKDQDASGQFTVSTQGEVGSGGGTSKITADLNYSGSSDPRRVVQESRNWIVDASTPADRTYGIGAQFGYISPDFSSGAEYLTSGSAQTGVIGRVRSRFGTFSYYQPVSTAIHGVMSGLDERLEIRSAAFGTPDGRPFTLRLIALEVEEPADEDAGVIGSELRTFGVYGRYDLSPALSLVGEVAHGKVAAEQSGDGRNGIAARVGISGMRGTLNYSANVRSIGANFVNPANRGLTPGGVSDRVMVDLNVGKTIGRAMLNFGVRRQDQGRSGESTMPRADETAVNLGLTTTLAGISVNVAANATGNRGDADEATFFPATHRDSSGLSATASRAFGRFSVSQTLNYQRSTDDINPLTDQTMTSAGLSANGLLLTNVSIAGSLNATRTKAVRELGTTNAWTASLQPSLAVPSLSLSFQPSISLSRSNNATLANESESEQYNLSVQWSPTWLGNLVGAQVTSSWSRSGAGGVKGALTRSYLGSLTVRMNKQRNMPWFPTAPLAGTVPPPAP